jgi:DNA-directed RNA polymerase specialized sigma24 family protein
MNLKNALDAVRYEFSMFKSLSSILISDIKGKGVIHNALLELFLIHMRAFIYFFYDDSPGQDDIVAEHFIKDWKNVRPEKFCELDNWKKNANKLLAHLTYSRLKKSRSQAKWPVNEITEVIEKVWNVFYEMYQKSYTNNKKTAVK